MKMNRMRSLRVPGLAVGLALVVLTYGHVDAGPVEGVAAYLNKDYATALRELLPLAQQGNVSAQFLVGDMFERGQGVPQDYVQAHMWLNLAASRLSPGTDHDNAVKARDDFLAQRMTPAQIAEAQRLAREWKPKPEKAPCP